MNINKELLGKIARSKIGEVFEYEGEYFVIAPDICGEGCGYCVLRNYSGCKKVACRWPDRQNETHIIIMKIKLPEAVNNA